MLSVILPCFNVADTIAIQLEALSKQTYSEPWELIVVNNGSVDNSLRIVEQYRDHLPNLRIVDVFIPPGPRLGVSHSYNVGFEVAAGDAFVTCEADDEVSSDWLAKMADALSQYDFVAGRLDVEKLNEPWVIQCVGDKVGNVKGLVLWEKSPPLCFCSGCNIGMRRYVYETVGCINESFRYTWDIDYCFRIQLAGFQLHFAHDVVVHYRLRNTYRALYRQSRTWAKEQMLICHLYNSPVSKLSILNHLGAIVGLSRWMIIQYQGEMKDQIKRGLWSTYLGNHIGSIQGIIEYLWLSKLSGTYSGSHLSKV